MNVNIDTDEKGFDKLLAQNGLGATQQRSEKRAAASRRNGQKSKGPTTLAGKQRASRNAVRVGLLCKTIPAYRFPLYYTPDEVSALAADIAAQLGCRSTFTHALAESIAIDTLKLRHIRTLEHALLDPDVERVFQNEQAVQQQCGRCITLSDEDCAALEAGAAKVRAALSAGTPISLAKYELDLVSDELWNRMRAARRNLEEAQTKIAEIEEQLKTATPEDAEYLKTDREDAKQDLEYAQEEIKTRDLLHFGIETQDDIVAVLTNAKPVPSERLEAWLNVVSEIVYAQTAEIRKRKDAQLRIESLRRSELLNTLGSLDRLAQLADYGAKVQRHMERTLAMLREVEGLSVMQVGA